jgi:hypothetical protein
MINSTIDNFSCSKFQQNDILFRKVIDTKSNNVLGYKNSDASNNFNYVYLIKDKFNYIIKFN